MSDMAPRFIVGKSYLNCQDYSQLVVGKGGVEYSTTFINFTGRPIFVTDRSGVRFRVPASEKHRTDQLIIRKKYHIPRESVADMQRSITYADLCHDDYPEFAAFAEGFKSFSDNHITNRTVIVDTPIDINDVLKSNVYVTNHDIVLSVDTNERKSQHPFSKPHLAEARYETLRAEYKGLGTFVEIIDNDNNIGDRYILIAKSMRCITPRRDITKESGIYLVTIDDDGITSLQYNFDEAEIVGLYRTKEDAISAGDTAALLEAEVAKLNHEVKTKNLEHQKELGDFNRKHEEEVARIKQQNLQIENETRTKDLEIQRINRERDSERLQFDLKHATMKAEYETQRLQDQMRSDKSTSKSKFWTEVFKLSAAGIAGGLAIMAAVRKTSK